LNLSKYLWESDVLENIKKGVGVKKKKKKIVVRFLFRSTGRDEKRERKSIFKTGKAIGHIQFIVSSIGSTAVYEKFAEHNLILHSCRRKRNSI
jgi:hypothetical protein